MQTPRADQSRCFVLVHGAYHGAWCWDLLRPELEQRGCITIAPDLPTEDPDAGAERYSEAVLAAVPQHRSCRR